MYCYKKVRESNGGPGSHHQSEIDGETQLDEWPSPGVWEGQIHVAKRKGWSSGERTELPADFGAFDYAKNAAGTPIDFQLRIQ